MSQSLPVRLTPSAYDDLRAITGHYADAAPGIDRRFQHAVADCLMTIARAPESLKALHGDVRRMIVKRFPYGVYYRVKNAEVRVVAIIHLRRSDREWLKRSND